MWTNAQGRTFSTRSEQLVVCHRIVKTVFTICARIYFFTFHLCIADEIKVIKFSQVRIKVIALG